jgi:hypothetical protein
MRGSTDEMIGGEYSKARLQEAIIGPLLPHIFS